MEKYCIAPYLKLGYSGDNLRVGFGSIQQSISDPITQTLLINTLYYLQQPRTIDEIIEFCNSIKNDKSKVDLVDFLQKGKYIIKEGAFNRKERYSRHALFYNMSGADPKEVQNRLKDSHVAIVGCGGIGNVVSVNLATAGIGQLTLVDNDVIDISNLTRQILFIEEDEGKQKTQVLKSELQKRASNIKIDIINELFTTHNNAHQKLLKCDLIVVSGDSPGIMCDINELAYRRGIPFINVGYIQDIAVFGPLFVPGKTPCYECFAKGNISHDVPACEDLLKKIESINKQYQAPSIGPVNMLAGSLASLEIIKYLSGFGQLLSQDKRVGIWTHDFHFEFQPFHATSCINCLKKER